MSAAIFEGKLVLNRVPAWHHLGRIMTEPMTAVEAAIESGLAEITYSKRMLMSLDQHGDWSAIPDKRALYRDATDQTPEQLIDLVHPQYPIMSNMAIAEILNPLSKDRPVETAGALTDGTTVFFTLQDKPVSIGGDECGQYFVLVDYKTPGKALRLMETKVRIVCQNTLLAGISAATMSIKIPHRHGTFEADTKFYVDLRYRMDQAASKSTQVFEEMARTKISDIAALTGVGDPVATVLNFVFPTPSLPDSIKMMDAAKSVMRKDEALNERREDANKLYERAREASKTKREAVGQLFAKFNDEFPRTANTSWALYNSVVEYADHRVGFKEAYTPRFRAEQAMFGKRADEKTRSFDALNNSAILVRVANQMAGVGV